MKYTSPKTNSNIGSYPDPSQSYLQDTVLFQKAVKKDL